MTVTTALPATELAARVMSVAIKLDRARIVPRSMAVTPRGGVHVGLDSRESVDTAALSFADAEPALEPLYSATLYDRVAYVGLSSEHTVRLFAPLRHCSCGVECEHVVGGGSL